MDAVMEKQAAEAGTGCAERMKAGGPFWSGVGDSGRKVSDTEARRLFREGEAIHAPNAGAGSYRAVLARLGFRKVDVEDWTSSAGDWCFRVRGGLVFQENRYPYHGFRYVLDQSQRG